VLHDANELRDVFCRDCEVNEQVGAVNDAGREIVEVERQTGSIGGAMEHVVVQAGDKPQVAFVGEGS
jgi:hypothetical protein